MTNLWQNLHNFYVSKFPSLAIPSTNSFLAEIDIFSNGKENQTQNEIQNLQNEIQSEEINEITNLWNDLYPQVYGYFYRRIDNKNTVEDLTALVLSSFLENVANGKIEKTNFGYLWQIARNSLFEYCRQKSKNFISLSNFDEKFIDERLKNQTNELIEKIKNAAQKCLKNDEFTMFCDYYQSDLGSKLISNSQNFSNNPAPNPATNPDNLTDKYNLKPATLRQKIHRIKLKLQKELAKQK